ncbi:putative mitochondrial protein, partial [Nicotiana attenuata]
KLDFPTFDGSTNPLIWLHRCEKFFSNQHTQEEDKVGLAAFHMLGEAQLWYHQLEIENPSMSWVELKDCCTLRFGPPARSNPLGELVNLKQTGTVEEYQRLFQERLARASKCVRIDQQVSLFTAGAKGLCYNCDDPYTVGHQCKKLFWLELAGSDDVETTAEVESEPAISLHAITGQKSEDTMQVRAVIQEQSLLGLVDSGSTHNFIRMCQAISFSIDNTVFIADFIIIPLPGFDMVLGVKWLRTLGPILWDFATLTMSFVLNGDQVVLRGHQPCTTYQLHLLQDSDDFRCKLEELFAEFADLFHEPSGLPPLRNCDHQICLEPGTGPVVVRPYRYPHLQKDEIERQCTQMLQQGIIQPSRSPFSSPCSFGETQVAYLGHVISAAGVSVDVSKIKAITDWPQPQSITSLRGFLGLTGYYRRFIKDYGLLAAPLTSMLKRNSFHWSDEALASFTELKKALVAAPVLQLPNFDEKFIVECDASGGALVWLRLQPYRQRSLAGQLRHKLSPKFYGPFQILKRIGTVAYQLQLPVDSKLPNVFHVSLLKPFKGAAPAPTPTLPPITDGRVVPTPGSVLRARLNRGTWEVLVQWAGLDATKATWE